MFLLLIALVVGAVAAFVPLAFPDEERSLKRAFRWACGGAACFALACSPVALVPMGHVGVPVLLGSVQGRVLPEGFNLVNPLSDVENMSVRTENYTFSKTHSEGEKQGDDSIAALSSNGMQMSLDVTVPFRLVPSSAPWVLKNFGPDYKEKILRPAICTGVREAVSHFSDQEAYAGKREALALKMQERLQAQINNLASKEYKDAPEAIFSLPQVMLRNVGIPEAVKIAIERKIGADQQNQAMEFAIAKEEKEARRRVIEARGIKNFQDIVSTGVNENLLRWKGIEATLELAKSPNSKVVIIGGGKGGLPLVLSESGNPEQVK